MFLVLDIKQWLIIFLQVNNVIQETGMIPAVPPQIDVQIIKEIVIKIVTAKLAWYVVKTIVQRAFKWVMIVVMTHMVVQEVCILYICTKS